MANYKLVLEDDFRDDFNLIALHCTEPDYKMAYLLNDRLGIQLKRCRVDLDYSKDGLEISFAHYDYEDALDYMDFDLLSNKCKTPRARTVASGGLFDDTESESLYTEYLLPELDKVDYLLKVNSDYNQVPIRKLLLDINEVDQVISAYEVELAGLKSKHNLIFD